MNEFIKNSSFQVFMRILSWNRHLDGDLITIMYTQKKTGSSATV